MSKTTNPTEGEAMYTPEILSDEDDDGRMPDNLDELAQAVIGHRIVSAAKTDRGAFEITLDNGRTVTMRDTDDCCAYTELDSFLLHPDKIDHIITGVGTTGGFTTWHIYADMGDVLELGVSWGCGNPFYYAYGFTIDVTEAA